MKESVRRMLVPTHDMFSPRGLLVRAAWISIVFLVGHLLGLREMTSILCGMDPAGGAQPGVQAFLGLVYVILYLAFTVVVPILVLAAGILRLLDRSRQPGLRGPACGGLP